MNYVDSCRVPLFDIEKVPVPRVLLGHNPFIGYSYFSEARAAEYREKFQKREAIKGLVAKSVENGVPGIFISCAPHGHPLPTSNLIKAVEEASRETGVEVLVISNMTDPKNDLERLARLNLRIAVIHGSVVDRMQAEDSFEGLAGMLGTIRDAGVVPGVVMHRCDNVDPLLNGSFDIGLYVSPFNLLGWCMAPSRDSFVQILGRLPKPHIAINPLAMGRIPPKEGCEWVFSHGIVNGCAIGIGSEHEMNEDYGILKGIFEESGKQSTRLALS
ncbi:MAG: hypothetical protein JTT11_09925 [Candidatus Brockarchaeota archaeon]|nr:hypothetical protein [Candidatus Brockarchaeota archaeon]